MEQKRRTLEDLSAEDLRAEVKKCHEHFQRCLDVLSGEKDVEPVELVDVSDSTDLELFYKCKEITAEIQQYAEQ